MKLSIFAALLSLSFLSFSQLSSDLTVYQMYNPTSNLYSTGTPDSVEVSVLLMNLGPNTVFPGSGIEVSYSVNGQTKETKSIQGSLSSGAAYNFIFDTIADLSACDTFNVKAWVSYANDPDHSNDTVGILLVNPCATASITERSAHSTVYPNPATDVVQLPESCKGSNVSIRREDGALVEEQVVNASGQVSVSHLTPGVYLLMFTVSGESQVARIVKATE